MVDVNQDAPAIAEGRIEIKADPQSVWDVLAGFEQWPEWQPRVRWLSMDGALTEGTVFRWKPGPTTISSTLRHIDPPGEIGWTGKTLGISAVHVWRLRPSNGGTAVSTEESWAGPMVSLLRGPMRKTLQKEIDAGLEHLKAEAERRAADRR